MADESNEIQEQQTQEVTPQQQGIQFEDIKPYGTQGGDTGLSSRLKLKRNFEKIKMWFDSHDILNIDFLSDLFLSKVDDDEAKGLIGFLKGAWFGTKEWMIDALGNATFNDTHVKGVLRALNSYINNVRSTNYTGDGMMDSGWRITNEYEGGNSKATFDYLYIRKKAIFELLELRKLSYIGGNFCLSPASGRAWQVDIYDAGNNLLGYDTYTVFYTLGGRILSLFSRNAANRFLGRKKRIARKLTEDELARARRVRVYLFSDDGTTKTMSNWTVGAQARCQTFNITDQMEYHGSGEGTDNPDVGFWTGEKVQNTYWWRLVSAVGRATAADGKMHDYVEFLVNTGSRTQEDAGSDIPAVGDEFVQFGHRTDPNQQHVIMIETANEDSPSFKFYSGINSWNLNGKRPIIISPKLFEVKASMFRWITEYGDTQAQLINRGLWVEITKDSAGKTRCYYNDLVSHNGAVWRCIVATGTHKEDASGHWYTQQELDRMSLEQIMDLTDVANYTTDEPGENSGDWQKYVYAAVAPYVKLSEALVAIPCEKDGKATAAVSKTITVKLMVTNLEATISSLSVDGADSVVRKDPNSNNILVSIAKGAAVTNKDYAITVEGNAVMPGQTGGQHYVATTSLSVYGVSKGNDAYDVALSPAVWIFSQATVEPYAMNIDKNRTGNSSTGITVTVEGKKQPFLITGAVASVNTIGLDYDRNSGTDNRVWVTSMPNNVESAYVDITIQYANGAVATKRIQIYCNLLGTWKEEVIGDTKTEIAERTLFDILDENGNVIGQKNLGTFIRSSSQESATLDKNVFTVDPDTGKKVTQVSMTNKRVSTAEGTITDIRKDFYVKDGNGNPTNVVNYYTKSETPNAVRTTVGTMGYQKADDVNSLIANHTKWSQYSNTSQTDAAISMKVNEVSQTLIDTALGSSGSWEQGGILNNTGYSYDNNKQTPAASDYIRTKHITPVKDSLKVVVGAGFVLVVYQFDSSGNLLRSSSDIIGSSSVSLGSDVRYVALEMHTNSYPRKDISPDDVVGNFVTAAELSSTGIDIVNKKIIMNANQIAFRLSSGDATTLDFNTETGVYKIGGFKISSTTIGSLDYGTCLEQGGLYLSGGNGLRVVDAPVQLGGGNNTVEIGSANMTKLHSKVVFAEDDGFIYDSVCFRQGNYSYSSRYDRLKIGYLTKGLGHRVLIDAPISDWPDKADVGNGEVYKESDGQGNYYLKIRNDKP